MGVGESAEDKLYLYYQQELHYLRNAGGLFAEKYPKIARRLDLHSGESADPHVERLIESFAFLTARLQRDVDEKFPRVTASLLSLLYPHLIHPIPSLSIAQFQVDPTKGKLTDGYLLPRGMPLQSLSGGGVSCRFKTSYDVTLWPLSVDSVTVVKADDYAFPQSLLNSPQLIRLRLQSQGLPLSALSLDKIRFYLAGESTVVKKLYELLATSDPAVFLSPDEGQTLSYLGPETIRFCGDRDDEALLPPSPQGHGAYRLLQEYFTFPQKFNFFEIQNLGFHLPACGEYVDLFMGTSFPLMAAERELFSKENFLLGCTPMINLFNRVSEPLRLTHFSTEYRLIPDLRRERTTEIYAIRKVSSTVDSSPETKVYEPYFSLSHEAHGRGQSAFWYARRQPTIHPQMTGTDMYLSFVNLDFDPCLMEEESVFAHLTCTNRGLAEQIAPDSALQAEEAAPTANIICLERPTPQLAGPTDATTQWQLISCLSLNHLSLQSSRDGDVALKELLPLLGGSHYPWVAQEIQGITGISFQKIVRRLRPEAWRGFAQGLEISLAVDEKAFVQKSPLMLANVLSHFFQLYVSMNSFTELVLKSSMREGEWRRWPIRMGIKNPL